MEYYVFRRFYTALRATNLNVDSSSVVKQEFNNIDVALFACLHQCRQPRSTEGIGVGTVTQQQLATDRPGDLRGTVGRGGTFHTS